MQSFSLPLRPLALAVSMLFLGGCATFSQDGGFAKVQSLTKERTGKDVTLIKSDADAATVEKTIEPLLAKPLTVDDAVTIALLNNRGLQADYAELGIAEANLVQAGRLQNPLFSFTRLTRGDELSIERQLMLPIMNLLTMPLATKIERRFFEQAQLRAASDALRVADETRRAYFAAVAAQETVKYMEQVKLSAEAGAELAFKMAQVGNWSKLDQAREQTFYADAVTQLARAKQTYGSEREKLTRLMGLWGSKTAFQLPDRLPALPAAPREVFRRLLASPNVASKRWVYRQYDHMVRTNTLVMPGMGAGVVRIKGTSRALALSVDCNARFVYLDPFAGAQLAVAEAARNVACAGGQPIGATNCLNFGNPQRPDIMWQFARAVEGMGAACRALDVPITGGNVSLYNETDGRAVLPTPVLGVVGLIEHADHAIRRAFRSSGDAVVLLGESRSELGGSEYLKVMHGLIRGVPPALDLDREAALQRILVEGASRGLIRSAHDCAEGGLAVTLAECAFDTELGVEADVRAVAEGAAAFGDTAALFGESASRVVVSVDPARMAELFELAAAADVPATPLGRVGGDRIRISIEGRPVVDESLREVEQLWSSAIDRYFEPERAIA